MSNQTQLIEKFYSSFSKLNPRGMNECYAQNIVFNDPVFGVLQGDEARAMWEMLCNNAKDFGLTFSNIQLIDEEYATCDWIARYKFSATGKPVVNKVRAYMKIHDGKIVEHSDAFRLSNWMGQALGWKGKLFGWTGFMKRAVQKKARASLRKYMERR